MTDDTTLEMYKLIIGASEIESEADDTISEYLMERAVMYANKLGLQRKKVKGFDIVQDPMSEGWVLVFMCERWF